MANFGDVEAVPLASKMVGTAPTRKVTLSTFMIAGYFWLVKSEKACLNVKITQGVMDWVMLWVMNSSSKASPKDQPVPILSSLDFPNFIPASLPASKP